MSEYPKIIAVDFDGCLCVKKWPDIGDPNRKAIDALIKRRAEGDKVILWTCREGQKLEEAVLWCAKHGLEFDAVNDNLPENKEYFGNNSRKVFANEYWDDRSVSVIATENPFAGRIIVFNKRNERRKRFLRKLKGLIKKWKNIKRNSL